MNSLEYIAYLRDQGITLYSQDGRIRFYAAAGAMTPAIRTGIEARRDALLDVLDPMPEPDRGFGPQVRGTEIPLSFSQERLWLIDRLNPGDTGYNMFAAVRLTGDLDAGALLSALAFVMHRHESLRTVFESRDGHPFQRVLGDLPTPWAIEDLSHLDADSGALEVSRQARREASGPFDLSRPPLFRFKLLRMGPGEHIALLTMHHIITDGWSMSVFIREMGIAYASGSRAETTLLPALPVQYPDYAVWQRNHLSGVRLRMHLDYWKSKLKGELPVLALPSDGGIAPGAGTGLLRFRVPAALAANASALARACDATLFAVLLTAFKVLLARYTGQGDLIVGVPVANRERLECEGMIGFFVNTLVMRTDLTGDPDFRQAIGRVRETAMEAFNHQEIPFEKLVQELNPERELERNPLFQAMFQLQKLPAASLALPGLTMERLPSEATRAKFELEMTLSDDGGEIIGSLEFNPTRFGHERMEALCGHYLNLLGAACRAPATRISALPILSAAEERTIVGDWNRTGKSYPGSGFIHRIFEERAVSQPEAPALAYEDREIDYAGLNAWANRIAARLLAVGAGPESRIGLCADRSFEMVAALLGILKSGGAYVPLDPEYPDARLDYMTKNAGIRIILAHPHYLSRLAGLDAEIIRLDADLPETGEADPGNPAIALQAGNLAYVIYTSGSTGNPKGCMNTHEAIRNRLLWMQDYFSLAPADRVLQKTPYSFDVSVWEFFWPLLAGACLVVARPGGHRDPAYIARLIKSQRITTIHFVPSMLRVFLEHSEAAGCRGLKRVICSGEALPSDLEQAFRALLPTPLYNLYGPTEAAVDVTYWECGPAHGAGSVPIGMPIANTGIYVLDPGGQPVPVGVPGELHIAGINLARGYLGNAPLTARTFVPDPFSETPGARMYRSGDRVRYDRYGAIEFLDRLDNQVKIRGFRIELGEVESAISGFASVARALVAVHGGTDGEKRLLAYVVRKDIGIGVTEAQGNPAVNEAAQATETWSRVFDGIYEGDASQLGAVPEFVGWNSSYDGMPIPETEMQAWVDETVEDISAPKPRRILEIGVGTGLLLDKLAPGRDLYLGTDNSQVAIDRLQRRLDLAGPQMSGVEVRKQDAADFSGIPAGGFDVVILNSVVQYFPDSAYLIRVLEGAIRACKPDGRIYIGDVRSLPLLRAYHLSVEAFRGGVDPDAAALRERVRAGMEEESELLVDPRFFLALPGKLAGVTDLEIKPKSGRYLNELSKFRYQVVLRLGDAVPSRSQEEEIALMDWEADGLTLMKLRERLASNRGASLVLRNVPNGRLANEWGLLLRYPGTGASLPFGTGIPVSDASAGPMPADFLDMGKEQGFKVDACWRDQGPDGRLEFLFQPEVDPILPGFLCRRISGGRELIGDGSPFTNDPGSASRAKAFLPDLAGYLERKLPAYMVPSEFIVMGALPLGPNGKVDRKALPAPAGKDSAVKRGYRAPAEGMESIVAGVFASVLSVRNIGATDGFFALGGHSLLAARAAARLTDALGRDVPLRLFFEHPDVQGMAKALEADTTQDRSRSEAAERAEMERDAELPGDIRPVNGQPSGHSAPAAVLLTGATGFLGVHLLAQVLEKTAATVYCLVKAKDEASAMDRLLVCLSEHGLGKAGYRARIRPLVGDLAAPLLGLGADAYHEVAVKAEIIIHNGAAVDFIKPYASMRGPNVMGTAEVLRLACASRTKPVHYVSTVGTLDPRGIAKEDFEIPFHDGLQGGYGRSKWVAERLVASAARRGLPTTIYRPARIVADSRTGVSNGNDGICRLIHGIAQYGKVPEHMPLDNMVPVDFAAEAIVELVLRGGHRDKAYHVANEKLISWSLLAAGLRKMGMNLETVPSQEWVNGFRRHLQANPANAARPFLDLIPEGAEFLDPPLDPSNPIGNEDFIKSISAHGITVPELGDAFVSKWMGFLASRGMLPDRTAAVWK